MDKNKKNLLEFIDSIDIKNINIDNLKKYLSHNISKNTYDISCDKKLELLFNNMILSDNMEELFLNYLKINIDNYYNKLNDILSKNNIAKLFLEISEYTYIYILSNNHNIDIYNNIFNDKINDIEYNLRNVDNLLNNINNNIISFEELVNYKPHELDIKLWHKHIERKKLIDLKKNNIITTDLYKCKKCGSNKCISWQMQTRSADEPMTIFVECTICGNRFRMG